MANDSVTLDPLIVRIRTAPGPDRQLEGDIETLLDPEGPIRRARQNFERPHGPQREPAPVLASLDAAVDLLEAVIPGASWEVRPEHQRENGYRAQVWCS